MTNHKTMTAYGAHSAYIASIDALPKRHKAIAKLALQANYAVATYSPGDGTTRYRFAPINTSAGDFNGELALARYDYFAMPAYEGNTALGAKEAEAMVDTLIYAQAY